MPSRRAVLVIWACFLIRAGFYASVIPLWEGYDEFSHFAMVQYVALHGSLPDPRNANSSQQVRQSLKLTPVPNTARDSGTPHDAYWRLPEEERAERQRQLRELAGGELAARPADPPLWMYEAQQAPLYYWLMAPFYRAASGFGFLTQVWVLRYAAVLLSSLVVPIACVVFRRVFDSEAIAVGATAILGLFPQLMFMVFRVGNESLAILAGSAVFLAALWLMDNEGDLRRCVLFGLALGLALLTKAYFLSLLPPAVLLLAWVVWRNASRRATAIRHAAIALGACVLISGWWYLRITTLTGSIAGEHTIAESTGRVTSLWEAARSVPWRRMFDFFAVTYSWMGNWSFITTRSWMYRAMEITFALAALGVLLQLARRREALPRARYLWLAAAPVAFFILGLCYQTVMTYRGSSGGSLGFYLYSLVIAEVVLLATGLARLLPPRWARAPLPVLAVMLAALEWFGTWILLLPYYTGLTARVAAGQLPAAHLSQYMERGLGVFFSNLAVNKPGCLTPPVLMALAAAHLVATFVLIAFALRSARFTAVR